MLLWYKQMEKLSSIYEQEGSKIESRIASKILCISCSRISIGGPENKRCSPDAEDLWTADE